MRQRTAYYVYDAVSSRRKLWLRRSIYGVLTSAWFVLSVVLSSGFIARVQPSNPTIVNATQPAPTVLAFAQQEQMQTIQTIANEKALEKSISNWLKEHQGDSRYGVALNSINDDSSVSVGSDQFLPASLYKVMLLPLLFDTHELKDFKQVKINGETLDTCVPKMLIMSDNPCGEAIGGQLGWANIYQYMLSHGYSEVHMTDDGIHISARDMNRFMADLYKGSLLNKKEQKYVFDLLGKQFFRAGIPKGCEGCEVMNKTGNNSKVRHDSAIIKRGGSTYALTIMSDGASFYDIAQLTSHILAELDKLTPQQPLRTTN